MQCIKLSGDTKLGFPFSAPSGSHGCQSQRQRQTGGTGQPVHELHEVQQGQTVMVQAGESWTGEQLCKEGAVTVVHSKLFTFQQHLHSRTTAHPARDRIIILFSALRRPHLDTVSSSGPPSTGKISINWCESSGVGPKTVMSGAVAPQGEADG